MLSSDFPFNVDPHCLEAFSSQNCSPGLSDEGTCQKVMFFFPLGFSSKCNPHCESLEYPLPFLSCSWPCEPTRTRSSSSPRSQCGGSPHGSALSHSLLPSQTQPRAALPPLSGHHCFYFSGHINHFWVRSILFSHTYWQKRDLCSLLGGLKFYFKDLKNININRCLI